MVDANVHRLRPEDDKSFRLAPHNVEAEQALLGAILVNNEAYYRVSDFLIPEHFYEPVHRTIYEVLQKIIRAGKTATPITAKTYLPEALAKRDENRANWPKADPEASCFMLGIPRNTYHNMPFQIFQADAGDLLMVYPFAAANRVINMTDFTPPPIDSWMGKSDGVWEGDTLVVTTTGQVDQSWLDRAGNHHSIQLKVTERFNVLDADHMSYEATLEDPLTYAEPWTIAMTLYRVIDENAQLLEHKCVPFADKLLYSDLLGLE